MGPFLFCYGWIGSAIAATRTSTTTTGLEAAAGTLATRTTATTWTRLESAA